MVVCICVSTRLMLTDAFSNKIISSKGESGELGISGLAYISEKK